MSKGGGSPLGHALCSAPTSCMDGIADMLSKRRVQKGWFRSSVMAPRASQTRSVPQRASLSTVRNVHRQNRCLTADGATLHACHNSLSPWTARWSLYYGQWSLRCDGNPPSSVVRPLAWRLYLRPGCEAEAGNPEQKGRFGSLLELF